MNASEPPKMIGALERFEDDIREQARKIAREAGPSPNLREEDLRAEGRFAVLEAIVRFEGWGLGRDGRRGGRAATACAMQE